MTVENALLRYNENGLAAAREKGSRPAGSDDARLREVCRDFEAIFIKQMLDAMRKTVGKDGLLDGGAAEDIFQDMLYDERSRIMAKTGSFGIQDLLFSQLKGTAENSKHPL